MADTRNSQISLQALSSFLMVSLPKQFLQRGLTLAGVSGFTCVMAASMNVQCLELFMSPCDFFSVEYVRMALALPGIRNNCGGIGGDAGDGIAASILHPNFFFGMSVIKQLPSYASRPNRQVLGR